MAEMRDQYGNPIYPTVDQYGNPVVPTAVDEYGNPLYQIDQYGNPISQPYAGVGTGTTTGTYGTEQPVLGGHAQMMPSEKLHVGQGLPQQGLQRTGSSSSSSSEDDGQGGRRRKKGLKEKIKEKIPGMGGHKTGMGPVKQQYPEGHREGMAAATGMTGHEEHGHAQGREKKGVLEKIKEKMSGH